MGLGFLRRLAAVEAILQAKHAPPGDGLAALLAWARRYPVDEDEGEPPRPLSGMARLLDEARDFLQKGENDE